MSAGEVLGVARFGENVVTIIRRSGSFYRLVRTGSRTREQKIITGAVSISFDLGLLADRGGVLSPAGRRLAR